MGIRRKDPGRATHIMSTAKPLVARTAEMDQWMLRNLPAAPPRRRRSESPSPEASSSTSRPLPELVMATSALMLREGAPSDSATCAAMMVHTGWVLRVHEEQHIPLASGDGSMQRVHVQLAREETDEVERAIGDRSISPREPGEAYLGWVDALGPNGPNLQPYEKPPAVTIEVLPSSPHSTHSSPRRSPRKKLTPEQVHNASGLPLSVDRQRSPTTLRAPSPRRDGQRTSSPRKDVPKAVGKHTEKATETVMDKALDKAADKTTEGSASFVKRRGSISAEGSPSFLRRKGAMSMSAKRVTNNM